MCKEKLLPNPVHESMQPCSVFLSQGRCSALDTGSACFLTCSPFRESILGELLGCTMMRRCAIYAVSAFDDGTALLHSFMCLNAMCNFFCSLFSTVFGGGM